jgi:hypothetical protein
MSDIWSKLYIGLHVQYRLLLSDFTKTWIFSSNFVRNNSHSNKRWEIFYQNCTLVFMYSTGYCCPILIKLEFSLQIFWTYSNIKFHENPLSESRVVPLEQTDLTKLTFAFRKIAKSAYKRTHIRIYRQWMLWLYLNLDNVTVILSLGTKERAGQRGSCAVHSLWKRKTFGSLNAPRSAKPCLPVTSCYKGRICCCIWQRDVTISTVKCQGVNSTQLWIIQKAFHLICRIASGSGKRNGLLT